MIADMLSKLKNKNNLSYDEISNAMEDILSGNVSDENISDFLKSLRDKGESDDELLGMLDKMQAFALHISPKRKGTIIDVCGTGGDNLQTFNISTTASFVIAAAGGVVAKHGNRSISGVSGSADIFEYFGYDLNSSPERVTQIINKFGIGFMFAQKFHPAMKNVANARKMIGGRTAFNLLGPLTNPAQVKNQLIGVFSDDLLERLALLLKKRGSENIMTVRSQDGLDELSTTSKNKVYFLKNGIITPMIVDPEKLGLTKPQIKEIQVTNKHEAVNAFVSVLNSTANNAMMEITAINEGIYDIKENLSQSNQDFIKIIKENQHATLITEIKFSSPSLGEIKKKSDPVGIAKSMINGGAKALSILTQPHLFSGSPEFFIKIRKEIKVPLLMKDIIIDKIQIDAAKKIGADYILLIQSLFDQGFVNEIDELIEYGHKNSLKILLESHTGKEFKNSLKTEADILGINNRNLDTLELDINNTKRILENYEQSRIVISESGIETPEDIRFLHSCGADAFLVGSSIMKSDNIKERVSQLVNAI